MKIFVLLVGFSLTFMAQARPVSREVLAIWNSQNQPASADSSNSQIHKKIEVIFNYYGLKLHYIDLAKGFPKELNSREFTDRFMGLISWFEDEGMKNPEAYGQWLKGQISAGKKVLLMGQPGFLVDEKNQGQSIAWVNQMISGLGFQLSETFFDNPLLFSIKKSAGIDFVEFERSLEHEIVSFCQVTNTDSKNEVWLSLGVRGVKEASDVIIVGKNGGYVQHGFGLFSNPQDGKTSWRVNPFKLVERIFVDPALPIPDTTTLNGKRLLFAHIDGDGFNGFSRVDKKSTCGEVIYREILERYDLPTTVSVITAEIDPRHGIVRDSAAFKLAKKYFAHPLVEPASHTFSHPLSWEMNPTKLEIKSYLGEESKHTGPILSFKMKDYKLDYHTETSGSLSYINKELSPPDKKAKIVLWSGSCLPTAGALKPLEVNRELNLNGGDSRMDDVFDSYSSLSGLYRKVDSYVQVYSGNANENVYTNLWTSPFSGFRKVVQTFERTELPRRIKPVNIYYHFYSAEHFASVQSLHQVYEWTKNKDLHPVFASQYAKIVLGFVSTIIEKKSEKSFIVKNTGMLKTLRFMHTDLQPDYDRSRNIIGHQHYQGNLYIFLGNQDEALVELTTVPSLSPHLISLNGEVIGIKKDKLETTYQIKGHVPLTISYREKGILKKATSKEHAMVLKVLN